MSRKANQFPAKCRWCGKRVSAHRGVVKMVNGKAKVRHPLCSNPAPGSRQRKDTLVADAAIPPQYRGYKGNGEYE